MSRPFCQAVRDGNEMVCDACKAAWDVDEQHPPECAPPMSTVCPTCGGSGDQLYLVGGGPDAHDEIGPCSTCGGRGEVL